MSYRTVREPTDEEIEELSRMKRQEVGRVAMRAHMVLLSVRDYSPSTIADLHGVSHPTVYGVSHPTVYKWIDRFDEEGPEGLYDREPLRPGARGASSDPRRGGKGRDRTALGR